MVGFVIVLFSLFLPSENHNLHAGDTRSVSRCNSCMSLRFGSAWLVIYFLICSRTFIYNIELRVLDCQSVGSCCHLFRLKSPLSSTEAFLEALAVWTAVVAFARGTAMPRLTCVCRRRGP